MSNSMFVLICGILASYLSDDWEWFGWSLCVALLIGG